MSEIALISARKNRLETAAKKGNKKAKAALELANSPNKFLSTVQIGITLIGILTGIFSGDKITTDVKNFVSSFEVLQPYADSIAVAIVVIILTFFSLVLGELLPKRIGLNHPEGIAKALAIPMKYMSKITPAFLLGRPGDSSSRFMAASCWCWFCWSSLRWLPLPTPCAAGTSRSTIA